MSIPRVVTISLLLTLPTMLSASPSIEVGQPFPEIHLPNMETGELEALSKYRGKRLLLIHFASW